MTSVNGSRPAVEPHVLMLIGMVFADARARLAAEAPGLRPSHLRLLEWLPEDGLTITELAERTGLTTQGCGQLVRLLAADGVVELSADEQDHRAKRVRTTAAGRTRLARSHDVVEGCEAVWADRVGEDRYRVFREVLAEVALGAGRADGVRG